MITIEEHEALAAFARLFGRTWRRELARRWENGTLLFAQVRVTEDELAALVRLKAKLKPSGLTRYKPPVYVVETRVDGLRWTPAFLPNERAPEHATAAEARRRIEQLLTLDDPTWRRAEYRITSTPSVFEKPGPMRCACGKPVMLGRDGSGLMALDPALEGQTRGVFVWFFGAVIPDPLPGNVPKDMVLYREHACSRPDERLSEGEHL